MHVEPRHATEELAALNRKEILVYCFGFFCGRCTFGDRFCFAR